MIGDKITVPAFREGDEVVLARGPYPGTLGIYRRQTADINWAEITERDGSVRSHPVVWLAHAGDTISGGLN